VHAMTAMTAVTLRVTGTSISKSHMVISFFLSMGIRPIDTFIKASFLRHSLLKVLRSSSVHSDPTFKSINETSTCPKDEETKVIPEKFRHIFYGDDEPELEFAGMANPSNTPHWEEVRGT
jgi:hypothetical protein